MGLHYLHQPDTERNKPSIFHRDVKSANILLDADGYAKIADAGIAREADSSVTMTGGMGTSGYIDPEYFETGDFTAKSDVFSYGVVLFELLTGLQAFDSTQQGRNKKLFQRARRTVLPADARAGFDEMKEKLLRDLAMECTAEDIDERPSLEECITRLLGEVREFEPELVQPSFPWRNIAMLLGEWGSSFPWRTIAMLLGEWGSSFPWRTIAMLLGECWRTIAMLLGEWGSEKAEPEISPPPASLAPASRAREVSLGIRG